VIKKRVTDKQSPIEAELEKTIRDLEKEIKRLKSENKTLKKALDSTDEYLTRMSQDKTMASIFEGIKQTSDVSVEKKCPNCGCKDMRVVNLGIMKILACNRCEYRNRSNE
jgi:hypothetical protein